ncbi:MAG: hypothetical protein K9N47_22420 [Prosthecobacter sp.]|uniref:hypothetical protein n=1 Tax=Prosthecobacter sp. TaxID=1965333 RepID=UPI00262EAADC|nr:hypothetical protein [Prosthecobacter sp.]MCF7788897.1 hypothetical protein [Prosthecobacter sp.]
MSAEPLPKFPRVRGVYQMTQEWRVELPDEYAKRFEKDEFGTDIVLWRPGITCWTSIYNQKEGETPAETLAWCKSKTSKDALREFEFIDKQPLRYAYLLHETQEDAPPRWGLYTFTFGEGGHVMMSIYFDREEDLETAKSIWLSITDKPQ